MILKDRKKIKWKINTKTLKIQRNQRNKRNTKKMQNLLKNKFRKTERLKKKNTKQNNKKPI